jgi:hypothetical protein
MGSHGHAPDKDDDVGRELARGGNCNSELRRAGVSSNILDSISGLDERTSGMNRALMSERPDFAGSLRNYVNNSVDDEPENLVLFLWKFDTCRQQPSTAKWFLPRANRSTGRVCQDHGDLPTSTADCFAGCQPHLFHYRVMRLRGEVDVQWKSANQ